MRHMLNKKDPIFVEKQRDAVCRGEVCPNCYGRNVKRVGASPDGVRANYAYDCLDCGEQWEGY